MPNTPSILNENVYQALRRTGMSKQRAARISNAQRTKDAGTDTGATLHGPGGLLSTSGIGSARRKKWGKRTKAVYTCGIATKAVTGQPGEHIAPGITRIHGNLCNVHGRYGPCDAGAAAKAPRKGRAPRKGAKPKKIPQTPEQRAAARDATRAQTQTDTLTRLNIAPDGQAALLALRKGDQPDPAAIARGGFEDAGLVERANDGSYRLTSSGRAALSAARTDPGRTGDTISAARDRVAARRTRQQAAADRRAQAAQRKADRAARRPKKKAPITGDTTAAKPFTVFKDARGQHRWIARTTTAYRDRDGEILSTDALDRDSQRMTATKQFGPLRYWHCGKPDPTDDAAPWGPGLDIGDCDYSVVIGRTRVESGTFRSPLLAEKMARVAHLHEMSPGFFHAETAPDRDGVFHDIRTFERSPVPLRLARASNLFTGFTVKESSMTPEEIQDLTRRFKGTITELGLDGPTALGLAEGLIATEKDASAQQIAFKSTEYPDLVVNGVTYKAFPPAAGAAPMDAEDDPAQGGDSGVDEAAEGEPPIDTAPEGDYVGDMSTDDFFARLNEALAPVLKIQDMLKTMGDMHGEMKTMMGGTATKDDTRAAEIAALKAENERLTTEQDMLKTQQATVAAQLAELLGAQPAVSQTEATAAFKSNGPTVPTVPTEPDTQAQSTPANPWASLAASVMPELYKNGAQQ